jgi:hypothetical protein
MLNCRLTSIYLSSPDERSENNDQILRKIFNIIRLGLEIHPVYLIDIKIPFENS